MSKEQTSSTGTTAKGASFTRRLAPESTPYRPGRCNGHHVTPPSQLPAPARPGRVQSWREALRAAWPCAACQSRLQASSNALHSRNTDRPSRLVGGSRLRTRCALCQEGLLLSQAAEVPLILQALTWGRLPRTHRLASLLPGLGFRCPCSGVHSSCAHLHPGTCSRVCTARLPISSLARWRAPRRCGQRLICLCHRRFLARGPGQRRQSRACWMNYSPQTRQQEHF